MIRSPTRNRFQRPSTKSTARYGTVRVRYEYGTSTAGLRSASSISHWGAEGRVTSLGGDEDGVRDIDRGLGEEDGRRYDTTTAKYEQVSVAHVVELIEYRMSF